MQIPHFLESNHPLVKSLSHHSDGELLTLFQRHPEEGKYFTAIFCRYSPIVYTLIAHSGRSPVQADYLFAITWRHIYHALGELDLRGAAVSEKESFNLQNWLINITALCINQAEVPPVESIHYSLDAASPPLWCYTQQALDMIPPLQRLIVVMSQSFHWSETRIAAYLQAEGETLSPTEVRELLQIGLKELQKTLPADIRTIYLGEDETIEEESEIEIPSLL
ncbi:MULTISPECIES: RNA polymerase sigma factor [Aerosakkonema]|uniref:RNA polymerase sigma factor n=1 Tax=Aerosakkonema TaxID=1246629 RepID=UPI0035B93020